MKRKNAFTLAEVLITLGIIGIVAAMTIPTLISNTECSMFKSQYKKTLSTVNQAAKMAASQYNMSFASVSQQCNTLNGGIEKPNTTPTACALINGTISGTTYFYHADQMKIPGSTNNYWVNGSPKVANVLEMRAYQLPDGSVIAFHKLLQYCTLEPGGDITTLPETCRGFIDVNGATLPNREVQCSNSAITDIASTVGDCVVRNNATDLSDIFPVVFHDSTVEPITNAARYVLNQAK